MAELQAINNQKNILILAENSNFYYLKSVCNCYTPLILWDMKVNDCITIFWYVNTCVFTKPLEIKGKLTTGELFVNRSYPAFVLLLNCLWSWYFNGRKNGRSYARRFFDFWWFLAEDFLIFIAISLVIFLWAVIKIKARYNLFK